MRACAIELAQAGGESHFSPLVLIIDDDPVFRFALEETLYQTGTCAVMTAEDGLAGNRLLLHNAREIDVITLDLSMPNRDGVQLLRQIGECGFQGRLILISGESPGILESAVRLASMLGLERTTAFTKPVNFEEVSQLVFRPREVASSRRIKSQVNVEEINSALRESRLFTAYQPRIDLVTGQLSGAEALARMRNAQGEMVDAGQMINLAEINGRITDITWRVIEIICEDCSRLFQGQAPGFRISFNVSGSILSNPQFADQLAEIFDLSGMRPENFIIELTETRLPTDLSRALESLTRLRMLGFGLAIDDFGTGYSNISQLKLFPFTELKIDKSFMFEAATNSFARACIEACVALARELNLSVTAEGIEDTAALEIAQKLGIHEAQGYLFGHPMTATDFVEFSSRFGRQQMVEPERQLAAG